MKCIRNLSISQLLKLSQRFNLNPQYKNPRKRKTALRRCLRAYWRDHPIEECSICWEKIQPNKLCVTPCAHLFCNECLIPYVRQTEKCPLCRAECSYVHLLNKMFKKPELIAFLQTLMNVPQTEESLEESLEESIEESIEDNIITYHINIYISIQKTLETMWLVMVIFLVIFIAYYCYLFIRKGLNIFCLSINFATIFCIICYMLS